MATGVDAAIDSADVQRLLALLRGVDQEYREAFDGAGKLVRPFELEEAELLLAEARDLGGRIAEPADLPARLQDVADTISRHATVDAVSARVRQTRAAIRDATGVEEEIFPAEPPVASRGAALYKEHCVSCHGERGKGDGPDAGRAETRPVDFTDLVFMRAETPADFFSVISLGRRRAKMPAWEDVLSVQQRWDLVSYVWAFRDDPRHEEEGAALFIAHCARCHAAAAAAPHEEESRPATASLTALDRMAARTDADLYASITDGAGENAMPAFRPILVEEERWKLVAFVRSLSLGGATPAAENVPGATHIERTLGIVAERVAAAADAYRMHEDGAPGLAAAAYLVFEPIEPAIAMHDASVVARVEREFVRLQRALRQPDAVRQVDDAAAAVARALDAAREACRAERSQARSTSFPLFTVAACMALVVAIGLVWKWR